MRPVLAAVLYLGLTAQAFADTAKKDDAKPADDPPHCTVTKVNDKEASLDIPNVWAKPKFAEYTCRTDGKKAALKYADENELCGAKANKTKSVKWTTLMGKKGSEKKFDQTAYCPKKK